MKISKIFAGMSAMAIAASMLTMVSASAATEVKADELGMQIYVMGNGNWSWQSVDTKFSADGKLEAKGNAAELAKASQKDEKDTAIGDFGVQIYAGDTVKLADNEHLTAKVTYTLTSTTDASYKVENTEEVDFTNVKDGNVKSVSILGYGEDWAKMEAIGDFTLTATVSDIAVKTVTPEPEPDVNAPADAAFAVGGKSWNKVQFDSLKEVKFGEWDGIWFQVGYDKDGFEIADKSKAKVVVTLKADAAPVANEDGTFNDAIRYADTSDGTKYAIKQEEGKTEYTLEVPLTDFEAAIKAVEEDEDTDKVWENGFGCNMQFGIAGTVTGYVTGVEYKEKPGVELPEYVYAYGDLEDNGNVRIELYNQWGPSGNDADKSAALKAIYDPLKVTDTLDVTFTISGLDALKKDINANAHMTFFDGGMTWATWNEEKDLPPVATNATIKGDGTYTVSIKKNPEATTDATGATVFAVDIDGLWTALGLENMKDLELTAAQKSQILADLGVTISDVKIVADGVQFLPATGDTPAPTPVDSSESKADSTSESTTDSTSKANSSSKKDANKNTTTNPNTGAAALAAVGVALAGAAVVASKKRK